MATSDAHPGNDYYVNIFTGTIQAQSNPILAAGLTATGWEGPYTWAQAKAKADQGVAARATPANPFTGLDNWFKNIGGQIASGIEGGIVALFKDLWDVIIGPLEIAAGVVVAIVMIAYIFKDDLASIAPLVGMAVL